MNCPHCGKDTTIKPIVFHWLHIDGVNQSIEKITELPSVTQATFYDKWAKKQRTAYHKRESGGVPLVIVTGRGQAE